MLTSIGWYWLLISTGFLVLAGFLAFGPYGRVKLGDDDEKPEFSTASWIAMLFAGGMGAGLIFWGVAEPLYHFRAPPGMQGETAEAARLAFTLTNLHWGLHAWSIYGICAMVIAYFTFRKKKKPLISTPIESLFPGVNGQRLGQVANILGVFAVVFGLAGSLTMGTLQLRAGLGELLGTPLTFGMSLAIMLVMYATYMTSTAVGVDRGIKLLSNINMVVAVLMVIYIALLGPTAFIFETLVDSIGGYFTQLPALAFHLMPFEGLQEWTASWTLTYMIWWLAWGPFVGIFIARISRGRTIREFCAGVILVPTLFSLFSGSVEVAKAMAVTGAIPFSVVLLLQVVGFLRAIRGEGRSPGAVTAKSSSTRPIATAVGESR
ncbi:MAG: BCCT family transporter [Gammaproteobacteria bacterium]|nr:BCCT family transporter [Gammaproteobacteria bacterium]